MFMGYLISQWVSVVEWFGIMVVLGVFVFCLSAYLSNWMLKEELKQNKLYKLKKNKKKKKQIFFDVA